MIWTYFFAPLVMLSGCVSERNRTLSSQKILNWARWSLKWVKSKADYDNVMQHITESPGKVKGDRIKNEQTVITFLSDGENDSVFFTHYGKKLPELYNNLPERVSPEEPFKPIPDKLMDQYLALIDQQQTYDPMSDDGQTRTV